jgi:hypothetical protein
MFMSADCNADARPVDLPSKRTRKRYARTIRSLSDLDGRTTASRRARALGARLQAGLPAPATAGQLELIQGCVLLSVLIGDAGIKVLHGQPVDPHALTALINCERRALDALGALHTDPKLVDGTTQSDLDAKFGNVWPEYRKDEAACAASALDKIAALVDAPDDDDPAKNDEPPAQEGQP